MGRPTLILSDEDKRKRRSEQIRLCKAKRKTKDPEGVKQKSALQRWLYRQHHPESVQKELKYKKDVRKEEKTKRKKAERLAMKKAAKEYCWKHLIRA